MPVPSALEPMRLKSGLIDLQAQQMFSDQFVMGEAALRVLTDDVDILEVALDEVSFKHRRNTGSVVSGINDLDRESDRMSRCQTELGAPVQADGPGGHGFSPNLAHRRF